MQVKTLTIEQMKKINAGKLTINYLGCDDNGNCCIDIEEEGSGLIYRQCGGINWYFSVPL